MEAQAADASKKIPKKKHHLNINKEYNNNQKQTTSRSNNTLYKQNNHVHLVTLLLHFCWVFLFVL